MKFLRIYQVRCKGRCGTETVLKMENHKLSQKIGADKRRGGRENGQVDLE